MKKTTKIRLIIAASLVLSGCILFAAVMTWLQWDFTKLETVEYEINTYEIDETFTGISINTDTADIVFALSDKGKCTVECYEEENATYSVSVEDSILNIETIDGRTVRNYIGNIGFSFAAPTITVYLPERDFDLLAIKESTGDIEIPSDFSFKNVDISLSTGDLDFCADVSASIKISTNTGDIHAEGISAGSLELVATTGDVLLSQIKCENLRSTGSTGGISLTDVIAAEKFYIERSSGDVYFDGCDAAEIFVETSTGDVTGTLLSEKIFFAHSSTGDLELPKTLSGGLCELTSSTGDIRIEIQ